MRRSAQFLLALALLGSSLQAQDPPPVILPDVPPDYFLLNWPSGPDWREGAPFGPTLTGRITDIPGGDAFLMRGDALFLMTSPQYVDAIVPFVDVLAIQTLGFSVTDFAISTGTGSWGGDVLLSLGASNGLVEHQYDPSTDTFGFTVIDGTAASTGASRVITADLDGDGMPDVLVANGDTVRTFFYDNGTYTAGWSYVASDTVQDMVVLRYDNDSSADVALMTASQVEIYNQAGPAFPPLSYPSPQAITKISRLNGNGNWLAIVFRVGEVDYLVLERKAKTQRAFALQVPHSDGEPPPPPLDLTVTAITTGDYNYDGYEDVIVAHEDFAQNVVFFNLAATSPTRLFGTGEGEYIRVAFSLNPATSPVPENQGTPAFWSDDEVARNLVVYPLDSLNGVGRTTSPDAELGDMQKAKFNSAPVVTSLEYDPDIRILTVHFIVPLGVNLNTYDYFQVGIWHREYEDEDPTGLAIRHKWYVWPSTTGSAFKIDIEVTGAPVDWLDRGPTYWMMLRFINGESPSNPIVHKATMTTISAWRLEPERGDQAPSYDDALLTFPWLLGEVPISRTDPDPGQSEDFGVCAVLSRMLEFDTNDPLAIAAPDVAAGEAVNED